MSGLRAGSGLRPYGIWIVCWLIGALTLVSGVGEARAASKVTIELATGESGPPRYVCVMKRPSASSRRPRGDVTASALACLQRPLPGGECVVDVESKRAESSSDQAVGAGSCGLASPSDFSLDQLEDRLSCARNSSAQDPVDRVAILDLKLDGVARLNVREVEINEQRVNVRVAGAIEGHSLEVQVAGGGYLPGRAIISGQGRRIQVPLEPVCEQAMIELPALSQYLAALDLKVALTKEQEATPLYVSGSRVWVPNIRKREVRSVRAQACPKGGDGKKVDVDVDGSECAAFVYSWEDPGVPERIALEIETLKFSWHRDACLYPTSSAALLNTTGTEAAKDASSKADAKEAATADAKEAATADAKEAPKEGAKAGVKFLDASRCPIAKLPGTGFSCRASSTQDVCLYTCKDLSKRGHASLLPTPVEFAIADEEIRWQARVDYVGQQLSQYMDTRGRAVRLDLWRWSLPVRADRALDALEELEAQCFAQHPLSPRRQVPPLETSIGKNATRAAREILIAHSLESCLRVPERKFSKGFEKQRAELLSKLKKAVDRSHDVEAEPPTLPSRKVDCGDDKLCFDELVSALANNTYGGSSRSRGAATRAHDQRDPIEFVTIRHGAYAVTLDPLLLEGSTHIVTIPDVQCGDLVSVEYQAPRWRRDTVSSVRYGRLRVPHPARTGIAFHLAIAPGLLVDRVLDGPAGSFRARGVGLVALGAAVQPRPIQWFEIGLFARWSPMLQPLRPITADEDDFVQNSRAWAHRFLMTAEFAGSWRSLLRWGVFAGGGVKVPFFKADFDTVGMYPLVVLGGNLSLFVTESFGIFAELLGEAVDRERTIKTNFRGETYAVDSPRRSATLAGGLRVKFGKRWQTRARR